MAAFQLAWPPLPVDVPASRGATCLRTAWLHAGSLPAGSLGGCQLAPCKIRRQPSGESGAPFGAIVRTQDEMIKASLSLVAANPGAPPQQNADLAVAQIRPAVRTTALPVADVIAREMHLTFKSQPAAANHKRPRQRSC